MMTRDDIKTLVAVDTGLDPRSVEASLAETHSVRIVGVADGIDQSQALLEETSPDFLIVATAGESERALTLIETAVRQRPERPIVVLYHGGLNGYLDRAFEAGADDLVLLPESPERIAFMLEKTLARRRGLTTAAVQGPMVAVLGPKGGTGKTLTSCNLAAALALRGHRTVLVDLDLQFGDVGVALGLKPDHTIYDLARVGGSMDEEKVDAFLTTHAESGLRVLLAPTRPDQAGLIEVSFLRELYKLLRRSNDVVVVDTPPAFTPEVISTVDTATHLCMVGMLDASSLKDSKLGLETLELMGHDPLKALVVLNRSTTKSGISRADAEAILGRTPDVFVPEDAEIPRALTQGRPIVINNQRSAAARAFSDFAQLLARDFAAAAAPDSGAVAPPQARRRRRLFARRKG
jgi:pilus assembly protein CpaE